MPFLLAAAALLACSQAACSGAREPSTPAARTPTPGSITRDNPAGDAQSPVDAALTRLLEEPIGFRDDKFETLRPRFSDAENWRRMRLFGYPTRAAFRYGKDRYAASVLTYEDAEGDDTPAACIERFVEDAEGTAQRFGVTVGPVERQLSTHRRGIEALDIDALKRAEQRWQQDLRTEGMRARRQLYRLRARSLAAARMRSREARATVEASEGTTATDVRPDIIPERRLQAVEAAVSSLRLRFAFERLTPPKPLPNPIERMILDAGDGDMPVVRTSGQMDTLFWGGRYLVAIVAYRSWPGTCLVQGFAVRVGTDEALAARVRERWIAEMAPALEWRRELRAKPPIENR